MCPWMHAPRAVTPTCLAPASPTSAPLNPAFAGARAGEQYPKSGSANPVTSYLLVPVGEGEHGVVCGGAVTAFAAEVILTKSGYLEQGMIVIGAYV